MSVIKTCVTSLVLKNESAQKKEQNDYENSCSFSLQTALMSLWWFLKNPKPVNDFNNLGYLSHNLKTLTLNIIMFLWIPNRLTCLINFSYPWNFLKTLPWWHAILIIPLFFLLMMCSYFCSPLLLLRGLELLPPPYSTLQTLRTRLWLSTLTVTSWSLTVVAVLSSYYLPHLSTPVNKK